MYKEKHLIIGAGFVGLGMAKACAQYGIEYDQVEADKELGGNWYHGVYPHVHIISSKKTTEYTDYPMPESYPDFPGAGQIYEYLCDYARNFDLRKNIEFNKTVTYVEPVAEQQWQVTFTSGEKRIYKGIIACNGHHWDKRFPAYPGTGFTGEFMHSKDYKGEEILKNKKVLVIGSGNSACDIAVDSARVAKETHISMRRGNWFFPKTMFGIPTVEFIKPWMPIWAQRLMLKILLRIVVGKYENYGLQKPVHKIFEKHPTINSLLLYYLKHGTIKPHPGIKSWNGSTIEFANGKNEDFDLIVAATGFHLNFPFLPQGLVEIKNNIPGIPAGTVHDKYKGLYLVGWGQPRYGVGPLITAGAPNICELIRIQEKLSWPVGAVIAKAGQKVPETHIIDPMRALASYKRSIAWINKLPLLEKLFFDRKSYRFPGVLSSRKRQPEEITVNF